MGQWPMPQVGEPQPPGGDTLHVGSWLELAMCAAGTLSSFSS